jgi:hypothetical protein
MATLDRPRPFALDSPYARLGLSPDASLSEVRHAYRSLVMRYHPDRAGSGSLADFLAIKAAYETLLAQSRSPAPSSGRGSSREARVATYPSKSMNRGPRWSGGRWYWEGLLANAARLGRQQRTG